jgi:NADPH:quinone reductase-like Zn-dependent oxidoreductase
MRALVLTEHGGLDRLRPDDLPEPAPPGPHQVRIAVKAAALNHLDLFVLDGLPGVTLPFPHIVGTDAAGLVEQVGTRVSDLRPGDRVVVNPGISCGECSMCASDQQPYCRGFGILGEHRAGTAAELLVVPARNVARVTDQFSWAEAAALPLATLTAWRMLATRARLQAGETVLIWGIGGGVALAALRIAKHLGARAIVTSSSAAKLERARALGADLALNHATQDVAKETRALTTVGADVVVDSVGEKTWDKSLRALRPGGRLVTCGATTGPHVTLDLRRLFWFQWSLLGSTMGSESDFRAMMAVANAGELRPVVDSVVPLERGAEAYARLASGEHFGKLVITIRDS